MGTKPRPDFLRVWSRGFSRAGQLEAEKPKDRASKLKQLTTISLLLLAVACIGASYPILYASRPILKYGANIGYIPTDPDAFAYQEAVRLTGGSFQSNQIYAVEAFVLSAKSNGYWTNIVDCSPLAGGKLSAALIKLKGTVPMTNHGLVSSNYVNSIGLFGATNKWVDTGYHYNELPTNHHGFSAWVWAPTNYLNGTSEQYMGMDGSVGPWMIIGARGSQVNMAYTIRADISPDTIWGQGLHQVNRQEFNESSFWIGGHNANQVNTVQTDTSSQSYSFGLLAGNGYPHETAYFQHGLSWYCIDNGMATNQIPLYHRDVASLMRALGRVRTAPLPTFIVVGQSLAVGSYSGGVLQVSASGHTIMPPGGSIQSSSSPFEYGRSPYVERNNETGWAAFGEHLAFLMWDGGQLTDDEYASYRSMFLNWGIGGAAYSTLQKGSTYTFANYGTTTNCYAGSILSLARQQAFEGTMSGNSIQVPAVLAVHGETDRGNTNYASYIADWQRDYEQDAASVTGQTNRVPMFHSQIAGYGFPGDPAAAEPYSDLAMLWAHENSAGSNVLVMPKYFLDYSDGIHLTNYHYRVMGEYYAEAVYRQLYGSGWEPLRPTAVTRTNAEVWVTFTGSEGGLTLDTTTVSDPGNYGFTFTNNAGETNISSVVVTNANTVVVTLSGTPTGANPLLRYAFNATSTDHAGRLTGARGCLRDQRASVGTVTGTNLYNWCVVFKTSTP